MNFVNSESRNRVERSTATAIHLNFRNKGPKRASHAMQPGVSDRAIELIAQLPKLTRLNLCEKQVTDASVSTLVGMRLNSIDVTNTQLTPQGVETPRAGLPHAEILC